MEPENKVQCDVCKIVFTPPPNGGVAVSMGPQIDSPEYQETKRRFGKAIFYICWSCWLKAFGIKEINNEF